MSRRDPAVFLRHMLDHAREAIELSRGRSREIVGEAAARLSREECARYPAIPWPEIVSLRNRLIHGYDQVDFDILWQIVIGDLPKLASVLEDLLVGNEGG